MYELKENTTGGKAVYKTLFNVSKEDDILIFEFYASHCSFNSFSDKFNDPIYNGDVVEVFIDLKEENHYLEIEVAPNGTMFVADIKNINGEFNGTLLNGDGITSQIMKNNSDLIVKITLNSKNYDISEDAKFNAFRIDTDNKKANRHLFALSPTLCGSFHKHEKFLSLKDYLN